MTNEHDQPATPADLVAVAEAARIRRGYLLWLADMLAKYPMPSRHVLRCASDAIKQLAGEECEANKPAAATAEQALQRLVEIYVYQGAAMTPASEIGAAWKEAQRVLQS